MLLNRENANKIFERAVEWDESFMAAFSRGVANTFSWIGSSVKKGLQKRKINALVMQWGLEYVKALHDIDTGSKKTVDVDHETEELEPEERKKIDNNIKKLIDGLSTGEFKSHFSNENILELDKVKKYLDSLLTSIKYDEEPFKHEFVNLVNNDQDKIKKFNDLIIVIRNINEEVKNDTELYNLMYKSFKGTLKPYSKIKPTESKNELNDFINSLIKDLSGIEYDKVSESYNYIVEASEFKLPNSVTELIDEEDLKELEKIEGIKEKATKNINFKTLDTILYEATYIIEKASKGKKEETGSELKKIWDIGIKNINNYFQNVINVDKVMKTVKADGVDNDRKEEIKTQSDSIDMIPEMGLTKLSPTSASFKDKEFYAFNLDIIGKIGKKLKNAYLLVSPIEEYIVNIENKSYFFFKVFGQYKTDENNKIIRLNPFEVLTNNKSCVNNFAKDENTYFLVFEKMMVSNKLSNIWVYSNKGSVFFDGGIHENATDIEKELKNFKYRDWLKVGNVFRCYVNSRFLVDKNPDNLKKYPGLQIADALNNKFNDKAKANHELLVKYVKEEKK